MKFNKHAFYNYQKKRGKNENAIKDAIEEAEAYNPANKWAYACAVLNRINGNYNEREHRERHESVKESREEFAKWLEDKDMAELLRGIG